MHLYCARSRFSKCQLFECTFIVSGHTFQSARHLNAPHFSNPVWKILRVNTPRASFIGISVKGFSEMSTGRAKKKMCPFHPELNRFLLPKGFIFSAKKTSTWLQSPCPLQPGLHPV